MRGESQQAGTLPALNGAAEAAIAGLEGLPFARPQRTAALDRVRPLDAYVSFNFHNNLISFGKQTLWWGPGKDGPFLFRVCLPKEIRLLWKLNETDRKSTRLNSSHT